MKSYSYKTLYMLFVLLFTSLKAQGNPQYNFVINKAENLILDNKYNEALENYSKLKSGFTYIYAKDIYNAMICANRQKNWEQTFVWAKLFLSKTSVKEFFNQKKFEEFRKTKYWKKILKLDITDKINITLKKKIDSLVNIDQGKFVLLKEKDVPDIYDVTADIDRILFKLDKEYGGISEDNVGLNITNDTIFSFLPIYDVLLRHSYQSKKEDSYFNYKNKNNSIEKDMFFSNIDFELQPIIFYNNQTYFLKEEFLSEEKTELLNYIEKAKKKINHNFSDFIIFYPASKNTFSDKASEQNFIKMLNTLYYQQ